jgi:hypothetical protein
VLPHQVSEYADARSFRFWTGNPIDEGAAWNLSGRRKKRNRPLAKMGLKLLLAAQHKATASD